MKDRYGEIQHRGELKTGSDMPQWYMGQFVLDNTVDPWTTDKIRIRVTHTRRSG